MENIGIIGRINNNNYTFNKEIVQLLKKYSFNPVFICPIDNSKLNDDLIDTIKSCDGFILQGGNEVYDIDLLILKYLHDFDIPTLGICLGHQTMGLLFNGTLIKNQTMHNSNNSYVHDVKIKKDTKLYKIIKKNNIIVNSRHNFSLKNTDLQVSASSDVIEAIEDANKRFFLGIQWHPESLDDENSKKIFNFFFKECKNFKKIKKN